MEVDSESSDSDSDEETPTGEKRKLEDDESSESSEEEEEKSKTVATPTSQEPPAKKAKTSEEASNTVFIGNLSWNTDEEGLHQVFADCGAISSVRIITGSDGRKKGYGYVEFESSESAQAALALTGTDVDGREIRVDLAQPRANDGRGKVEEPTSPASAILFVGNLSFSVTEDQVRESFGQYGDLISVRFPTDRETGEFKGFGYVQFDNINNAKAAVAGLNGVKLAGRPLRLDYAADRPDRNGAGNGGGRGGRGGGRGAPRGGRGGRGGGRGAPRGSRGGFSRGGSRGGFAAPAGRKTTFE